MTPSQAFAGFDEERAAADDCLPPSVYVSDYERCLRELFERRFCQISCRSQVTTILSNSDGSTEIIETTLDVDGYEATARVTTETRAGRISESGSVSVGGVTASWADNDGYRDQSDPFLPYLGWIDAVARALTPGDQITRYVNLPI